MRVHFTIVGIGSSAGGLDALKRFFSAMPADSGMAFVLIQHLDPAHKSLTADLLAKCSPMAVVQVADRMPAEPNRVYAIPPNAYLAISERRNPVRERGVPVHQRGAGDLERGTAVRERGADHAQ